MLVAHLLIGGSVAGPSLFISFTHFCYKNYNYNNVITPLNTKIIANPEIVCQKSILQIITLGTLYAKKDYYRSGVHLHLLATYRLPVKSCWLPVKSCRLTA